MLLIVSHFGFPHNASRSRSQRNQVTIQCSQKDLILIDGDISGAAAGGIFRQLSTVLPDQLARTRIEGLHHIIGMGKVHHSLVDDRFLLLMPILHRPRPRQAQPPNILAIHLLQWAVSAGAVIATPTQPIGGIGISKDGVGDRNKVRLLCTHWADSRYDDPHEEPMESHGKELTKSHEWYTYTPF